MPSTPDFWPQFIGEEGEYKIYNCWKTDTIGYGEVQIFKNNTLIRNEKSLQRPSQGTFDVTTFLIGLSLLTGNTPSTTTNNQTTPVPGFLTGETISGFNKICYYNRVTGTVTLNIPSTSLCPLTYWFILMIEAIIIIELTALAIAAYLNSQWKTF